MHLFSEIKKAIAAVVVAALALAMIYQGLDQYSIASDLKAQGVEVPGQVINSRKSRGYRTTNCFVTVSYEPRSSESSVMKEFEVSSNGYRKLQRGTSVKVRHLPRDPKAAQLIGEETNGYFLLGIGSVLIFASAVRLANSPLIKGI